MTDATDSSILEQLLEGCQVVDFDYRYVALNEAALDHARRRREELLGLRMEQAYPGIESTPMFAALRRCMEERTPGDFQNDFDYPDGTRVSYQLRFVPVRVGVCVLSLDVTDRVHPLAAIVHDSDDAILAHSLDGRLTSWNEAAERLFGWARREVLGRRAQEVLDPSDVAGDGALLQRIAEGERVRHVETVLHTRTGAEVWVSMTISPVRDVKGRVVGASRILRDVSHERRAKLDLQRAMAATRAANEELEAFGASVAHDLRAPLRSIEGFGRALLEEHGGELGADGTRLLQHVVTAARHMDHLIDDLLDLSRVTVTELRRERVDLVPIAARALERLRAGAPTREVDCILPPELVVDGDERLLEIVLTNLLGNAWKFTAKRAQARIELGRRDEGGASWTFVRDDGAGFDMAHAHRLFRPFQRLHRERDFEGTGIGLATVQRIVRRHGGEITARGAPGCGAELSFTLEPPRERGP